MEPIIYKGYTIREATGVWSLYYGLKFEYFNDERLYHCRTLQECFEEIDERTNK